MDIKLILIPIDFSDYCKLALNYAVSLAHKFNAKLELVHVAEIHKQSFYSYYTEMESMADFREHSYEQIHKDLEKLKRQLPSSFDLQVETIMRRGDPVAKIVDTATRDDVDLIVISAARKKFRPHIFHSGIADQIVRSAQCPVLTVLRPKGQDGRFGPPMLPKKILVASDLSKPSFRAVETALYFADRNNAKLELFHVAGDTPSADTEAAQREALATMQEAVKIHINNGVQVEYLVEHGEPESAILAESKEANFDMIVMYTHGRHGLQHALHHNVCERILSQSKCPVLTVREEEH